MNACAFVVGPATGPGAAVAALARRLEFTAVQAYAGIEAAARQARRTPLLYFLCTAADPLELQAVAREVRFCPHGRIRFSPLIYFAARPSLETLRACIGMGFDDVIALPLSTARARQRLQRQLERPLVYYETPSYFGPDRRNRLGGGPVHSARGSGGDHRRIEIRRVPGIGIDVLRDEHLVA